VLPPADLCMTSSQLSMSRCPSFCPTGNSFIAAATYPVAVWYRNAAMESSFGPPGNRQREAETHGKMSRRPISFNCRKIVFDQWLLSKLIRCQPNNLASHLPAGSP